MSDSIQKHHNGYHQNRDGDNQLQTYSLPYANPKESNALDPKYLVKLILRYKWLILLLLILGGTGVLF